MAFAAGNAKSPNSALNNTLTKKICCKGNGKTLDNKGYQ